ncbi:MAG: TRAP transporter small permease [Burkholderiales bacterium]|nr:TRAP transporter small permease [Burkholderiales bacterium]
MRFGATTPDFLGTAQRTLGRIDAALSLVGAAMMILIMAIVAADVFSRYAFNAPFAWSYDLISVYLMPGIFFFFLSDTFRENGHVAVDIAQQRMPPLWRHAALLVVCACALVVFALVLWASAARAWHAFAANEVLAGGIAWPIWIAAGFVPVGAGMLVVRLLLATIGHALSVLTRRTVIALPPLSGQEEAL